MTEKALGKSANSGTAGRHREFQGIKHLVGTRKHHGFRKPTSGQ
tara:strand:- start:1047 stop:1178 length:132 start_codon:yes stop_codon:yes gene_type:complete